MSDFLFITVAQPDGDWPEGLFRRVLDVIVDDVPITTDSVGAGETVSFSVLKGADVVARWFDVWGPDFGFVWEPHRTQIGFTAAVGHVIADQGGPVVMSIVPDDTATRDDSE